MNTIFLSLKIFFISTVILFWSCASNRANQTSANLVLDINMPLFGINDSNPPKSFKLIDTISVSSTGEDFNAENFFEGHGSQQLQRALRIKAANLGANTLVDVRIEKKTFTKKSRFGTDQPYEKNIITGKAVYDSNTPNSVSTAILDAIIHKYKGKKKPLSRMQLTSTDLEGGSFVLNKNLDVIVSLKDYHLVSNREKTFELIISKQEINQFLANNSGTSYRLLPYGISFKD